MKKYIYETNEDDVIKFSNWINRYVILLDIYREKSAHSCHNVKFLSHGWILALLNLVGCIPVLSKHYRSSRA